MKILRWNIRVTRVKAKLITDEMRANRFHLNSNDCRQAENFIDEYFKLIDLEKQIGKDSLYESRDGLIAAAIVSYGRAFTENRGGDTASNFEKINLGSALCNDRELMALHKLVLNKRHKAVAHTDSEFYQSNVVEVRAKGSTRVSSIVEYSKDIDISLFKKLANTMKAYFMSRAVDLDLHI